jgi:hypothetical protein
MLSPDQSRFLRLCHEHDVRALVIGGQALVARGLSRITADLDVLVSGEAGDAEGLTTVLRAIQPACNFESIRRAASKPRQRLFHRLPDGRVEIDVLTSIDGIVFADAFARADQLMVHGVSCAVAAVPDLIAMKRVSKLVYQRDGELDRAARDGEDIAMLKRLAQAP